MLLGNWSEANKLTASDTQAGDFFGWNVTVSGDIAVVGAWGEDAGGSVAGAAYVFHRNQGGADNWGELKKLTASDVEAGDRFGIGVAVSGDTAVMGADEEGGAGAGVAYVFEEPAPVGGIAELPQVASAQLEKGGSPGPKAGVVTGIAAAVAASALALGGVAWYARRGRLN